MKRNPNACCVAATPTMLQCHHLQSSTTDFVKATDVPTELNLWKLMGDFNLHGITVPAGSDVVGMKCKADRVDDGYVLNGSKKWCTNVHLLKR
ncbi:hypothetical protein L2E82_33016 [Cichorium intybus]|uniref:Uncharacterized protein n=1 Tax=Cichorium intybus TaxID=13427 RepID=A0ACB9BIP8_CICIN|nr:hypothetical protein L2E82_33016 [Cichorium intybus]